MSSCINGWIFVVSVCAALLICCYPWAHFEGGRINGKVVPWSITLNMSKIYSNGQDCKLRVTNESASLLKEYFVETDDLIVSINIKFDNKSNVNIFADNAVILPLRWIWTYGKGSDYLWWPQEYFIWSFGFLNYNALADIPITFTASPPPCTIYLGHSNTSIEMASALRTMVETYFPLKKRHYQESYWCYSSIIKDMHADFLVRNFGYFVGQVGYRCCNVSKENIVKCSNRARMTDPLYTNLPFYMAFFVLLFSPLLLSYVVDWIWPPTIISQHQQTGYFHVGNEEDAWVLLNDKSPITFLSIIISFLVRCCSRTLSRLSWFLVKVLLLVVFFPMCVYAKLLLYTLDEDVRLFLADKIQHNLPVGFSSMLFTLDEQMINFLTITGGPSVMFIVFSLLGLAYLFLEEFIISDDVRKDAIDSICLNDVSHEDMSTTMKQNCCKIFTKSCWEESCVGVPKYKAVFNSLIIICFHFIPLLFAFGMIIAPIFFLIDNKCASNCKKTTIPLLITGILCCYVLFAYCAIFIASFEFLSLLVTFVYTALVKSPEVTGGYVALVVGVTYIIVSSLRYPAHRYLRLLHLATKSLPAIADVVIPCTIIDKNLDLLYFDPRRIKRCKRTDVNNNSSECILIGDTVIYSSIEEIESFCVNTIKVQLSKNESDIRQSDRPCIKYLDGTLAVHKDLYMVLVNELKPITGTMAVAVLRSFLSVVLFFWTAILVNQMHQIAHINVISNFIMAYVIVKIPELAKVIASDTDTKIKKSVLKRKIVHKAMEYMKKDVKEN